MTKDLRTAAQEFLDAFGGDIPDWLRPHADALADALSTDDGFIRHDGGPCPVPDTPGVRVRAITRGNWQSGMRWEWGDPRDIIAYKLVPTA